MRAATLVVLAACGSGGSPATKPPPDAKPVVVAPPLPAPDAAPPVDPRVADILAAANCYELDWKGMPMSCPEGTALAGIAQANPDDAALARGCALALGSRKVGDRSLGAWCLRVMHGPAIAPHFGEILDAIERETHGALRIALAGTIANHDLVAAGHEERVIALVRRHAEQDDVASALLMSIVRSPAPTQAVGDLVLELATPDSGVLFITFSAMPNLLGRAPEVCAKLAELSETPALVGDVVKTVARMDQACVDHLDPVIDALIAHIQAGTFDVPHYLGVRALLQETPLSDAQRARLRKAARVLPKQAHPAHREYANDLVQRLARQR